ncbi:MAG: hypothetical protein ACIAXF_17780 [Phycisphaerales bacterium JB063]
MPEPEPVVMIHGIAMRRAEKVASYASTMQQRLGEGYRLVPVYWGDLGADDTYLHKVIARYEQRSTNFGAMMRDAFTRPMVRGAGKARAWVEAQRGDLRRSSILREQSRRHSTNTRANVHGYLGDKFQEARLWLTQQSLPFLADVIVYQSHTYRQKIHERVREVIDRELGEDAGRAGRPIKVIAHSLGGVVAFDMAVQNTDPLHVEAFVTLGSQPAFFHLLDPREGLAAFEGDQPVELPATIGRWTNVWDEYDLLAFGTGEVFRLHDGRPPIDTAVRCTRSRIKGAAFMKSHLGYFESEGAAKATREALDGPGNG